MLETTDLLPKQEHIMRLIRLLFARVKITKLRHFLLTFLSISVELCEMDAFIQFAASHPDSLRR